MIQYMPQSCTDCQDHHPVHICKPTDLRLVTAKFKEWSDQDGDYEHTFEVPWSGCIHGLIARKSVQSMGEMPVLQSQGNQSQHYYPRPSCLEWCSWAHNQGTDQFGVCNASPLWAAQIPVGRSLQQSDICLKQDPYQCVGGCMPYKIVYGIKPNLTDLWALSASCALVKLGAKLKKLDEEVSMCVFSTYSSSLRFLCKYANSMSNCTMLRSQDTTRARSV